MDIQLSISLLASDRQAALGRCLDSLRPLIMQVPSELIVVVTGKDEEVRRTAARYTSQVIPFTWCNDFSAARNAGLKAAKGEWFLYIDDDEWFEDTSEIRDFFLSGEYKAFGTAFYRQRNYHNWDGIHYSDSYVFRMARLEPGIMFKNPIHEELSPRQGDSKFFGSYVHHYGYVLDAGKAETGKTARNIPILLEDIRKNPSYIKNYIQLTQEYYVSRDWKEAEKYCRKGRRLCRGKCGARNYQRWLQVYLADILCKKGDARRAEQEILSMLRQEAPSELACLCLYSRLVELYTQLGENEKTILYGQKFEKLLDSMERSPQLWQEQSYGAVNEGRVKKPESLSLGRLRCAEAALKLGFSNEALYFLNRLPWADNGWMERYYPVFDQWMGQYAVPFSDVLKNIPCQDPYLLFQKASAPGQSTGPGGSAGIFKKCLEGTQSPYLREQIIKKALLSGMDLSALIEALNIDTWKAYILNITEQLPYHELLMTWDAAETLSRKKPLYGLCLEKLLREKKLIRGYLMGVELDEALSKYCQCILRFYKEQFREEMFREDRRNLLPDDCRFALFITEALKTDKGLPESIRLFRCSLQFCPAMTGVIKELIRQMKSRMDSPSPKAGEEFQSLAAQMKQGLLSLAEAGRYDEAMLLTEQLSPLLPEDLELLRIRQGILLEAVGNGAGAGPIF